jgi:hypothetical protein
MVAVPRLNVRPRALERSETEVAESVTRTSRSLQQASCPADFLHTGRSKRTAEPPLPLPEILAGLIRQVCQLELLFELFCFG